MRLLIASFFFLLASSAFTWVGGGGGGGGGSSGDMTGPTTSVDGDGIIFNGITGKVTKVDTRYRSSDLGAMFRLTGGEFFKVLDIGALDEDPGFVEYDADNKFWKFRVSTSIGQGLSDEGVFSIIDSYGGGKTVFFQRGQISFTDDNQCDGSEDGIATICNDSGTLSVEHGSNFPIALENRSVWTEEERFYSSGNTPETTSDELVTFDTSDLNVREWPQSDIENGTISQGSFFLEAMVLLSEYGTQVNGTYHLKARGRFSVGPTYIPTIDSVDFTEKDDDDGEGGNDCYFETRAGGIDLKCYGGTELTTVVEYSGWMKILLAGGGQE